MNSPKPPSKLSGSLKKKKNPGTRLQCSY